MSNLLAAVGRGQIGRFWNGGAPASEQRLLPRSSRSVPGIEFMPEALYGRSNYWLTCITIDAQQLGGLRTSYAWNSSKRT